MSSKTHFHKCPRCEHLWEHSNACHGDHAAHVCSNCGLDDFMCGVRYNPDHQQSLSASFETCAADPAKLREGAKPIAWLEEFLNF